MMETNHKYGIVGLIVLAIFLVVFFIIPWPDTIYESCDRITVKEVPLKYADTDSGIKTGSKGFFFPEYWYSPQIKVQNIDNAGGVFKIITTIYKTDGTSISETQDKYIAPGLSETIFFGPYKFTIKSAYYQIIPPTKEQTIVEKNICPRVVYRTIVHF